MTVFPAWLTARRIAHRGLHDGAAGIAENSLGAARAAIARGFAIECDIALTRDGEALVFHDATLERLTGAEGPLAALSLDEARRLRLKIGGETIPTLAELIAVIGGRVPLVCEIKSHFDGDVRLAARAAEIAAGYAGPLALESFDPALIAHLRAKNVPRPLGIVAEASYDDRYFAEMSAEQKRDCAAFLHIGATAPDFLSWRVDDLPHPTPTLMRALGQRPVLVWTVRTPAEKALARAYADQIVFEGEPD